VVFRAKQGDAGARVLLRLLQFVPLAGKFAPPHRTHLAATSGLPRPPSVSPAPVGTISISDHRTFLIVKQEPARVASKPVPRMITIDTSIAKVAATHARIEVAQDSPAREFASNSVRSASIASKAHSLVADDAPSAAGASPRLAERSKFELGKQGWSPADIQRLTDQVVKSLDQRLVAYRERMGRR
jgi:hypothetical protein